MDTSGDRRSVELNQSDISDAMTRSQNGAAFSILTVGFVYVLLVNL